MSKLRCSRRTPGTDHSRPGPSLRTPTRLHKPSRIPLRLLQLALAQRLEVPRRRLPPQAHVSSRTSTQTRDRIRRRRRPRHVLTPWAVPALPEFIRVIAPRDGRAADVAWQAGALVDPHAFGGIQRETRAALAAIAVEAHQLSRLRDETCQRRVVEIRDLRPRGHALEEQRLALEDVADPRDRPLIEERGRDVALGRARAPPAERLVRVELVADDVRPEFRQDGVERDLARRHQLDDRRPE